MPLSLKRHPPHYSGSPWDEDDWLVLSDGEPCGRITLNPVTRAWHWQIAYRHRHIGAEPHEGHTVDREGAMAAFKAAWLRRPA